MHCPNLKVVLSGHGIFRGSPLIETLFEIYQFLKEYPSEFLFVTFQEERENALNDFAKRFLQTMIVCLFQGRAITSRDKDSWFKLQTVTVGDYMQNNKNLFICFNGRIGFSGGYCPIQKDSRKPPTMADSSKVVSLSDKGIHLKYDFYRDKWFNTDDSDELLKQIDLFCEENKRKTDKMLITQFILTISKQPKKLVKKMFFEFIPTLGNINRNLNKDDRQITFIDERIDKGLFNIGRICRFCFLNIH